MKSASCKFYYKRSLDLSSFYAAEVLFACRSHIFCLLSIMPTNAELASQFTALQDQLSVLAKNMPTKADFDKLATKDELKSEFVVFKAELRKEMDDRFLKYKEEQAVIIEDLKLRVTNAETKLTNKISVLDAQRLMDLKYSYRINSILIGIPEKEGHWKETPGDCQKHVEKVFDMFLPDPSLVQITDCHRLGAKKPAFGDLSIYVPIQIFFHKLLLFDLNNDFMPGAQFSDHSFLVCFIVTSDCLNRHYFHYFWPLSTCKCHTPTLF